MKEGYEYIIDHIPGDTPHDRRPGLTLAPEFITIHSTGNPNSSARNERAWLTNPANDRTASWHICIDESEAVEAIPLDEVAWHAGDGSSGLGNRRSIALEICESGDRAKTLDNAAMLTAKLLQARGWGVEQLRRHYDWSGKACPRILMADNWAGWENFKNQILKQRENGQANRPLQGSPEAGPEVDPIINGVPAYPAGSPAAEAQAFPAHPAGNTPQAALPRIQRRVAGTLNGRHVEFEAYLIDNSTYVPLRPLAAALGLSVEWEEGKFHLHFPGIA